MFAEGGSYARSKSVPGAYPCECGKVYSLKNSLWYHKRYNCGRDPEFSCSFCSHRTHLKSNFKRHLLLKHPGELLQGSDKLVCCGRKYSSYGSMWTHKKYYCGKPPMFVCNYCNHRFHQKTHFKFHMITKHKGLDPQLN
ncbi:hypothetical protein J6590_002324 [Homalodisca vitripennis]|nr:hypothetical protein J6590_002324 [Homalodisca vitripennis]